MEESRFVVQPAGRSPSSIDSKAKDKCAHGIPTFEGVAINALALSAAPSWVMIYEKYSISLGSPRAVNVVALIIYYFIASEALRLVSWRRKKNIVLQFAIKITPGRSPIAMCDTFFSALHTIIFFSFSRSIKYDERTPNGSGSCVSGGQCIFSNSYLTLTVKTEWIRVANALAAHFFILPTHFTDDDRWHHREM